MPPDRSAADRASRARLHSRYTPEAEAERYLKEALGDRRPSLALILGAADNHLGKALRSTLPGVRIVVLQPSRGLSASMADRPDLLWEPGSGVDADAVLDYAASDGKAAAGVAVIEWPPAMRAYPEGAQAIRRAAAAFLERNAAGAATRSYWAARWLKNSLRFALALGARGGRPLALERGAGPLIVAGAGPGLAPALRGLKEAGLTGAAGGRLWCLASGAEASLAAGFAPSLCVATDPGHWNRLHIRRAYALGLPLALPPSAAAPAAALESGSVLPLDLGTPFDRAALAACGADASPAGVAGTAFGSALSLALASSDGPVIALGMDLAARGFAAHTAPYALDAVDLLPVSRLSPRDAVMGAQAYERYPERLGAWRLSRAFKAYAQDSYASAADAARCLRLSDSPVDCGLPRIGLGELAALLRDAQDGAGPSLSEGRPLCPPRERALALEAWLREEGQRLSEALAARASPPTTGADRLRAPFSHDDVVALLALCGREAAVAVAQAARGELGADEAEAADRALGRGLRRYLEALFA